MSNGAITIASVIVIGCINIYTEVVPYFLHPLCFFLSEEYPVRGNDSLYVKFKKLFVFYDSNTV